MRPLSLVRFLGAIFVVATLSGDHDARAQLPPGTFNAVIAGLVGVESRGCPETRYLQGFVVDAGGLGVVTARHGVAGCTSFSVTIFKAPDFVTLDRQVNVHLAKTLNRADLALLRADNATALGSASLAIADMPPPNTSLYSVARWLSAPGARDKLVRVANGAKTLANIASLPWLSPTSSPAADLEILNIDVGTIIPGTSGSPIVNDAGQVVAIADGGLEGGLAGINWAIPSRNITSLVTSTDARPTRADGTTAKTMFSKAVLANGASLGKVTCGSYDLVKVRSEALNQLAAASDDPLGLAQVQSTTTVDPATTMFDVYQVTSSGATIYLPQGVAFQPSGTSCVAHLGARIAINLQMVRTNGSPADVQAKTVTYEQQTLGSGWAVLTAYPFARPRFDGLTAMRKNLQRQQGTDVDLSFETLASLGSDLVEYSAIFSGFSVAEYQRLMCCRQATLAGPTPPGCAPLLAENADWGRAILGVHLTTFSVGRAGLPPGSVLPWVNMSNNFGSQQINGNGNTGNSVSVTVPPQGGGGR
jgi:S1-C subfamily serine protease